MADLMRWVEVHPDAALATLALVVTAAAWLLKRS